MSTSGIFSPMKRLIISKPNASMVLMIAAILAVITANSPLREIYSSILSYPISLKIDSFEVFTHHGVTMDLLTFANDVLMVLFFLQVGLEIKQEILVGELSTPRKAILPVVGALGGMAVPVLLFLMICPQPPMSNGAAIPMATDIAFVLAILGMLGSKVPPALKAFITSLAVADDIGGIIVIALFYSSHIDLPMLLCGGGTLLLLYLIGRMGIRSLWVYYIGLFATWFLFLQSGIHTTIAGVLVAFMVPARPRITTNQLGDYVSVLTRQLPESEQRTSKRSILLPHSQVSVVNSIRQATTAALSPVQRMESQLSDLVSYFVLPLFAFVNAGVTFGGVNPSDLVSVPLAIVLGLFVGKPLGITLFSYAYIRATGNHWPTKMTPKLLFATSILGGVGFTVSLFVASLSYKGAEMAILLNDAKLGIFTGSILSGLLGYYLLKYLLNHKTIR